MKPKFTLCRFLFLAGSSQRAISSVAALIVTLCLLLVNLAQAVDGTWVGATNSWTTGSNWSSGSTPGAADTAFFSDAGVVTTTITIPTNTSIGAFSFSGSVTHIFNSGILWFQNSAAITSTSSQNITFNTTPARFQGVKDFTITNNGAGLLSFTNGGNAFWKEGGDGDFIFDGSGNIQLHSITKRFGSYTTSLTKNGAGTLTITNYQGVFNTSGTNNAGGLTNDTTINNGTVRITSGDQRSLGQSGVASATWLTLNGGALQVSTVDLNINHANGGVYLGASDGTFNVDASRTLTIGGGGATNIITGAVGGDLIKSGSGTLSLTGTNTYTGTSIINAGTLSLSGASNVLLDTNAVNVNNAAGTFDISAVTTGETIGSLSGVAGSSVVLGSKNLTVGDANNTAYDGVVSGSNGSLTKVGLGDLTLGGSNTYSGVTQINAGKLRINDLNNLGSGASGNSVGMDGGTLQSTANTYALGANRSILLGASGGTIQTDADTLTVDGVISGLGSLTKTGVGALTVSNTNTYTGSTMISAGTLNANSTDALGDETNANNTLIFSGGTLQASGTITSAATRGVSTIGTGGTIDTNSQAVSIAGIISGTGGLTKSGTGTLTLTATNSYSGTTLVSAGTLQLGNAGPTGSISPSSAITNNATMTFNRTNTVTQGTDFASVISGSGGVIQAGTGTLVFNGTNTYTGTTTVSAGTLLINGDNSAATGAVTVAATATLGGSGTVGGNTTIDGIHSPGTSPGIQTFIGDLTYSGGSSVVNWELKGNTITNFANPNAIFDQMIVGGNLIFNGATTLNLDFDTPGGVDWSNTFWNTSHTGTSGWLVYDVGGTTTGFPANLNLSSFSGLLDGDGDTFSSARSGNTFTLYQDGSDIYLNYTVAIPEPGRVMLLFFALAALFLRRRR